MTSDDHDPSAKDNTVSLDEKRAKKQATGSSKPKSKVPPLFNIPSYTKYITGLIVFIYLVQQAGMDAPTKLEFYDLFGFVPNYFKSALVSHPMALITPLTYTLLHGSLLHIAINSLMLLAFGAGIEKWLGGSKMLMIFFVCGIVAALIHCAITLAFNPISAGTPVIGASGATSGLFAVGIIMLRNLGVGIADGPYGIIPLIAVFIAISFVFSLTGSMDGASIAWIAHIGGFLTGLGLMKVMKKF